MDVHTVDFSGSNTNGSFTKAVLNSVLSPLEKNPIAADLGYFRLILSFYIENGILFVLIRIA